MRNWKSLRATFPFEPAPSPILHTESRRAPPSASSTSRHRRLCAFLRRTDYGIFENPALNATIYIRGLTTLSALRGDNSVHLWRAAAAFRLAAGVESQDRRFSSRQLIRRFARNEIRARRPKTIYPRDPASDLSAACHGKRRKFD